EPKIKYYLFAHRRPEKGKFDSVELNQIKTEVKAKLDRLWERLHRDAESRLGEAQTAAISLVSDGTAEIIEAPNSKRLFKDAILILSQAKDLWPFFPALQTIITDVSLRST